MKEMASTLQSLTDQIANLKKALAEKGVSTNGGTNNGDGGAAKRKRDEKRDAWFKKEDDKHGPYTSGMAHDESWNRQKSNWWYRHAKKDSNKTAFKAYEKARAAKILANVE